MMVLRGRVMSDGDALVIKSREALDYQWETNLIRN